MTPDPPIPQAAPDLAEFRADVLAGLSRLPKSLPAKYFYDAEGSRLFDQITALPEYYPTRVEAAIMEEHGAAMARLLGPQVLLIEYGSGSSVKTRVLLEHLDHPAGYVPVDISCEHLERTAALLRTDYPAIPILPVCADYSQDFPLPAAPGSVARRVVYFPGSTIGNLAPERALRLLTRIRALIGGAGGLLIGVDLRKDARILVPAYDDAAGVTAAFNKNILVRINRELAADFDPDKFEHAAFWNDNAGRIEMHLVSLLPQTVQIGDTPIPFEPGESICTEYSYKYTLAGFAELAAQAALGVRQVWTDTDEMFSVQYLTA